MFNRAKNKALTKTPFGVVGDCLLASSIVFFSCALNVLQRNASSY